jgi:hypothetical protein
MNLKKIKELKFNLIFLTFFCALFKILTTRKAIRGLTLRKLNQDNLFLGRQAWVRPIELIAFLEIKRFFYLPR